MMRKARHDRTTCVMAGFGQTGSNCHLSHFSAAVDDMGTHIYLDLDYQHQNASHSIPCLAKKHHTDCRLFTVHNRKLQCRAVRVPPLCRPGYYYYIDLSPDLASSPSLLSPCQGPPYRGACCLLTCLPSNRSTEQLPSTYSIPLKFTVPSTVATPRASCRIWGGRDNSHPHGNLAAQHIQP